MSGLGQPIESLRGVGEARAKAFHKLGVKTMADLLRFVPRSYQDFSKLHHVEEVQHGELVALRLIMQRAPQQLRPRGGLFMVVVTAADATGALQLVWYNQPYRARQVHAGETRVCCGRVDTQRGRKLVNPLLAADLPGILAVYPMAAGLSQKQVRDAVRFALREALPELQETLPDALRQEYGLCEIAEALHDMHCPPDMQALEIARYRLAFEDMLYYLLAIGLLKAQRQGRPGIAFQTAGVLQRFLRELPYPPTGAQARVLEEIERDMAAEKPMNRLVQGDVGSGKTVLAFFALQVAVHNGRQGVMMAPTELLAQQHFALLQAQYGERALLLSGGMKKKEKESAYARIASGEAAIVVGTHALLQSALVFRDLGLVVTDEQHRFGVRQRAAIINKAEQTPDALVMSATPIPRTLAMLFYGDLDLSVLDELPPGRRPVMTRIVPPEKREDMYRFVEKQAEQARRTYVVCPLVEQSEALEVRSAQEVYAELLEKLPSMRIALLHGRMAAAKKEETLQAFRDGELDILVSTTVVEVGVDVPSAACMVIEGADRFGLAQLHQLRGRVGRGQAQSFCFLLSDSPGEAAQERLHTMVQSNDGFYIAQKDLEQRGPGEFLGTRQHGEDEAHAARLAQNMDVLFAAQRAAEALLRQGEAGENARVFAEARRLYADRMKEIANN